MTEPNQRATADLSPSAAMHQMIAGYRISRAIYVAAKLGIADLLKDGPLSSEGLAQATGTHAEHRVLMETAPGAPEILGVSAAKY